MACLQAFPARIGAERTRTAVTHLTPDLYRKDFA